MATHTRRTEINEFYFCTFTCYKWLPLFVQADAHNSVYSWFEYLHKNRCYVSAFVIMPNHIHVLLYCANPDKSLNTLIGNGKRFMAYEIVKQLKKQNKDGLLKVLTDGVSEQERDKAKLHQVFRTSFDAIKCFSLNMLEQKLNYIHNNPVSGKWSLVDDYTEFEHSSAGFYDAGKGGKFQVVRYKEVPFSFGEGFD